VDVHKTVQRAAAEARKNEHLARVRPLCGTVIETEEFSQAVKGARVTGNMQLDTITILVRSLTPDDNLSDVLARRKATRYELVACRVIKVGGTTGGAQKVRFQETGSDRYVVVVKSPSTNRWRVCSTYKPPSGRSAGARTRGHGADRGTS